MPSLKLFEAIISWDKLSINDSGDDEDKFIYAETVVSKDKVVR